MSISGIGSTGYLTGITGRRNGVSAASQINQSSGSFAQTIQNALTQWRIPESNSVSSLTNSLFTNSFSNSLTNSVSSWYRPSYVAVPIVITEEAYEKMQEEPQLAANTMQSWWNNSYANMTAFPLLGMNPSVASAYQQILNGFTGSIM
ncbi:MAG: hypothetical protein J6K48_15835 [Lachnospiraceae bacterium]|nr:hypothetical protein [Lachnospiraceae bacterium]